MLDCSVSTVQKMITEKVHRVPYNNSPARANYHIEHSRKWWISESMVMFLALSRDRPWTKTHKKRKIKNTLTMNYRKKKMSSKTENNLNILSTLEEHLSNIKWLVMDIFSGKNLSVRSPVF